ncbi:PREDICTED: uncharacterized protein LOC104698794 [Camelina sativa]|uniref:Uncharacterized protein LOC104698794 n=1 Tax=Camelina sativa TaxID=90675 RepID=A0ABM0SKJ4_CAMSA|nr:PREDICTED: uncharacterized protein LOC104698794 [Camelina sativa]
MSLYLFMLAMEVFLGLLRSRYTSGYISYHPRTSEVEISHLMFADDVMIFFDGDSSSLHGIYETLEDFAGWSGLHMNRGKTQLFHVGLTQVEANALASYGFTPGSLPIRYLGLPLMSRKLKVAEYAPLIEKLKAKFNSWATRSLSFAGRVQLITSKISGLGNFWISTFILPLGCIRQIESLCSRFLWSGKTDKKGIAKIAWSQVCLPRAEGGLSLRRLRTLAERFIMCNLGNGRIASFWFDNWTPFGPLIKYIGDQGPRDLRIPLKATLADACDVAGWKIVDPRSEQALQLHVHLTTIGKPIDSLRSDSYIWMVDKKCNGFSSSRTWEALRPRAEIVN